ncbi:MAG TPA: hypothetical protein VGP33_18820, partial [Chloroflexota bacterium]|nr:hypothetical protein [Chloroflexota bacterium]
MSAFTLALTVREDAGLARTAQVVEQGLPAPNLTAEEVQRLGLLDADGRPRPGEVAVEARDGPTGAVSWLCVTAPVTLDARATA